MNKILSVGIISLFILSAVAPMSMGLDVKTTTSESRLMDNLDFYFYNEYGSNKADLYREYLEQDISDDEEEPLTTREQIENLYNITLNQNFYANDTNGDGVYDLPDSFLAAGSLFIKKLTIKGIKDSPLASFINSNIAAFYIDKISLMYPQYDNNGIPFGILADYIKKTTVTDSEGKESFSDLDSPSDSIQNQDAEVRIV